MTTSYAKFVCDNLIQNMLIVEWMDMRTSGNCTIICMYNIVYRLPNIYACYVHVLDGPEGGTITIGDYYRSAKYRKLHAAVLCL